MALTSRDEYNFLFIIKYFWGYPSWTRRNKNQEPSTLVQVLLLKICDSVESLYFIKHGQQYILQGCSKHYMLAFGARLCRIIKIIIFCKTKFLWIWRKYLLITKWWRSLSFIIWPKWWQNFISFISLNQDVSWGHTASWIITVEFLEEIFLKLMCSYKLLF